MPDPSARAAVSGGVEDGGMKMNRNGLHAEIERTLLAYVKARSTTNTAGEREAEAFFLQRVSEMRYFKAHPDFFGSYAIEGDALGRSVGWALLRGRGDRTVVLIHHNDVVDVEDFRTLKDYAYSPIELEGKLLEIAETLPDEVRRDLESDAYLFGRGVCDMKGGGSIQLALLDRYGEEEFTGNLVVLGLPDEENLSAGMRAAVKLLSALKREHGLNYVLMINSEPHQRRTPDRGVLSTGSIGKMMPFVYMRGSLAHAGKVFEGFNPVRVLSKVVCKTETCTDFSDVQGSEFSPPPTWLHLKDSKTQYDVSMPLSAYGCFSVLTLSRTPREVLERLRRVSLESFEESIRELNSAYEALCRASKRPFSALPWRARVLSVGELIVEAERDRGESFRRAFLDTIAELKRLAESEDRSLIELNRIFVDWLFDCTDDLSPCLVYGLIPPYYPHVSNIGLSGLDPRVGSLSDKLEAFAVEAFGQEYETERFYTGISDLSYCSISNVAEAAVALRDAMPFWGLLYDLPLDAMADISMPCINIGPWGKDFHKMTERVLKEDLFDRTPRLIAKALELVLGGGDKTNPRG